MKQLQLSKIGISYFTPLCNSDVTSPFILQCYYKLVCLVFGGRRFVVCVFVVCLVCFEFGGRWFVVCVFVGFGTLVLRCSRVSFQSCAVLGWAAVLCCVVLALVCV